jgi:hypothetical protein
MAYMSGSKMARNTSSIINRPTCGGNKKVGLSPTIGVNSANLSAYRRAPNSGPQGGYSRFCVTDNINTTLRPTQQIGYRATLGMM